MFNKKNDPLVESVKAVMKQNEVHRQAEAALNEELGISSKKALPHEYHAQYDALLEAKVFHADAVEAGKLASKFRDTVDKLLTGKSKKTPDDDHYKQQLKRRKGTLDEKINMSKADIAELRPPKKKFTGADLAALRAGEHKMEEESGLKSTMNGTDTPAKGAKPAGKLEEKATEAQKEKIHKVMSEFKRRKLHSGSKKGPTVTSREQAVAIALNQAGLSKKKMNEAKIPSHEELIDAHKSYFNKNEMERTPAEIADAAKYMHKALSNPDHPDHSNAKKALRQIMAESVIDEIRENLEANLIAIHESGDDELFENYVNSLTEEELEILGLNERDGDPAATTGLGRSATFVSTVDSTLVFFFLPLTCLLLDEKNSFLPMYFFPLTRLVIRYSNPMFTFGSSSSGLGSKTSFSKYHIWICGIYT